MMKFFMAFQTAMAMATPFNLWTFDLVKGNSPVLHSLQKEGCQKSIKKWIFDDPSHINRPE